MVDSIKNIIFDLGGVLVDIKVQRSVDEFAALNIGGLGVSDIHPNQRGFFLDYELGLISSDQFIAAIRSKYDCSGVEDFQIWNAWNILLQDIDMRRFELLKELRKKYKIFLLSNTNEAHIEALKQNFEKVSNGTTFGSYFDTCFYSHTLNLRKPDTKIYQKVIDQTGINPAETLFIDDNDCNFSGAIEAGLKVYHLTNGESVLELFKKDINYL